MLNSRRRPDLSDPAYVAALKSRWPIQPEGMYVCEFSGNGDPFFGGGADDRFLGEHGRILGKEEVVALRLFPTIEAAHEAVMHIPNRRPHSLLGVVPVW